MNAAPVIAVALLLLSVIVRAEVPLMPIAAGLKALAMAGCDRTVNVAAAPPAVPAFAVVTLPVLFA